jgi:integrase
MITKQVSFAGWEEWQQVANGTLNIDTNIPISSLSHFEDEIWDFNDVNKPRTLCFTHKALQINWSKYSDIIPESLLRSIRVVSFFIVKYPLVITSSRNTSKHGLAPSHFCQSINGLQSFMAELCKQAIVYVGSDKVPIHYIERLSDITILDIKKAAETWNCKSLGGRVHNLLGAFTSPIIKAYLPVPKSGCEPVNWTTKDLKEIDFPKVKQCPPGEGAGYRDKPLSDPLFNFLVSAASQDVLWFLVITGQQTHTIIPKSPLEHPDFNKYPNFKKIYRAFLTLHRIRCRSIKEGKRNGNSKSARNKKDLNLFKDKFSISYIDVRRIIDRIEMAAKYLLLQFTGLRYSEAAMLRVGCLKKAPSGEYMIKGTVIKGGAVNSLTGLDYWIACPIVRDSLLILENTARSTHNKHLFANEKYSLEDRSGLPIVGTELNKQLSEYLYDVDKEAKFCIKERLSKWRYNGVLEQNYISVHRLRHTLALQMSRAGLGIPYISIHMKHVYQAYKSFQSVQDATLGYGGIGADIFHNAVGIRQANREIVHSLYHPQSAIAGPSAKEFKQKRAYYFTGMQAAGWQMDEIMEHLAARGLPFADVGLGYCKGRREIEQEDGSKELPPCLGQLKCNPNRCKNAIIPQSKIPIWKQVYTENRKRANDPLLAHSKLECQQLMSEAQQVLATLGIDVAGL